jgi:hypothetical protein
MRFKGLRVSWGGCSFGAGLLTGLSRTASSAVLCRLYTTPRSPHARLFALSLRSLRSVGR